MKILICGLPGSGKTTLASKLVNEVANNAAVEWLNADVIRQEFNDWDFSTSGRHRQMMRIKQRAHEAELKGMIVICDLVCPTTELRKEFAADMTIWLDTISTSKFNDTNQLFELLDREEYDFRITEFDSDNWSRTLADLIWILE